MATRGRKRKNGARHPAGKLVQKSPAQKESEAKFVVRAQRLKRQILEPMDEPRRGSPIGRAFIYNSISESEYEAAEIWNGLFRRWFRSIGVTINPSLSADMNAVRGKAASWQGVDSKDERVKEDYQQAASALFIAERRMIGSVNELNKVTVFNQPITWLSALRHSLKTLSALWHLDAAVRGTGRRSMNTYIRSGAKPTDRPDLREH